LPVPVNPGSVLVSVVAVSQAVPQNAAPLSGVTVHVTDIPNSVGSTYSVGAVTGTSGQIVLGSIPAGNRGVDVTVPAGFIAGPESTTQRVDVIANQTVAVGFILIRQ